MPKPSASNPDLVVALAAALKAGEVIRRGYQQDHRITEKGLGDLVSQIDTDCDRLIQDEIHAAYPNDPILSEELSPEAAVSGAPRLWVVDPLDGTSAYLFRAGPELPSVMVALCEQGQVTVAVVHFPLTNETFHALRGQGAFQGQTRLRCADTPLAEAWVDLNHYSDVQFESPAFRTLRDNLRRPGGARLVTTSAPHSGLSLRIAQGHKKLSAVVHDNGPRKLKQAPWDVLAPGLILREAGGVVVNLAGRPYDAFAPEPFIMAGSPRLAQAISRLAVH